MKKTKNNIFKIIIFFLLIVAILTWQIVLEKNDTNLYINFLDVGQGDAIHVRTGNIDILVDAGPGKKILEELGKTMPFYDRTIEYVFLSHSHLDHYGGLIDVIANYNIENIYLNDHVSTSDSYVDFLDQIEKNNISVKFVHEIEKIEINNEFYINNFWPKESYIGKNITNPNNTSTVSKLIYKNISVLFTGDIENSEQAILFSAFGNKLKSDIIKISHHGSKNATNADLLQIVNPEIAVICAGQDNRFGHPHIETLDILELFNIRTFRTDTDGTITIISDGINFWKK